MTDFEQMWRIVNRAEDLKIFVMNPEAITDDEELENFLYGMQEQIDEWLEEINKIMNRIAETEEETEEE